MRMHNPATGATVDTSESQFRKVWAEHGWLAVEEIESVEDDENEDAAEKTAASGPRRAKASKDE